MKPESSQTPPPAPEPELAKLITRAEESEKNIEVVLTDPNVVHCFKIVFRARPDPEQIPFAANVTLKRIPLEIYLHTTQAVDLFTQLATALSQYMNQASAELLRIKKETLGAPKK